MKTPCPPPCGQRFIKHSHFEADYRLSRQENKPEIKPSLRAVLNINNLGPLFLKKLYNAVGSI